MEAFNDIALWETVKDGSVSAFEQLYRRYAGRLYQDIARRIKDQSAVADLLQDVFLTLWEKRGNYQIEGSIYAYLQGMAANRVLNYYRKNRMQPELIEVWDQVVAEAIELEDVSWKDEYAMAEKNESLLLKTVNDLPSRMRQVYELRYERHLTIPQIAEELRTSPHTIYNQIKSIKKKCQDVLKNKHFFFFF